MSAEDDARFDQIEERLAGIEQRESESVARARNVWGFKNPLLYPSRYEPPGFMRRLSEIVVVSAIASADFQNITPRFRHLQLVCLLRSTYANPFDGVQIRFNGDSSANYDYVGSSGAENAASPTMVGGFGQTSFVTSTCPGASMSTGVFSPMDCLVPYYSSELSQKTAIARGALKKGISAGDLIIDDRRAFYRSFTAVNRVTVSCQTGNLEVGSIVSLYGMA